MIKIGIVRAQNQAQSPQPSRASVVTHVGTCGYISPDLHGHVWLLRLHIHEVVHRRSGHRSHSVTPMLPSYTLPLSLVLLSLKTKKVATPRAFAGLSLPQRLRWRRLQSVQATFASPGRCLPVSSRWSAWHVEIKEKLPDRRTWKRPRKLAKEKEKRTAWLPLRESRGIQRSCNKSRR